MPLQCPGQDSRYMKPQDVTEVICDECGSAMEFWPDEYVRRCRGCGARIANPRLNLRCLEWCTHADECIRKIRGFEVSLSEVRASSEKHAAQGSGKEA